MGFSLNIPVPLEGCLAESCTVHSVLLAALTVGLLVLGRATFVLVRGVWRAWVRPGRKLSKYGSWAIVTGATDGIGEAIAFELARKGLNLCLISRTQSKLDATRKAVLGKYPSVSVSTLSIDFCNFDAAAKAQVADFVDGHDVGVLVNNVGCSYPHPKFWLELDDEDSQRLVALNVVAATEMTRIVLPAMVDRLRGAVTFISSVAGRAPNPLLAQYSATKSYMERFAESLALEYGDRGIKVQVQSPHLVVSKLSKVRRASLLIPSAKAFARASVGHIGYEPRCTPYWSHKIVLSLVDVLPAAFFSYYVKGMHLALRKRALAKKNKTK